MDAPASTNGPLPAVIRRPGAEDWRERASVAALRETGAIAAESGADAARGAAALLRFAGLVLILCLVTPALVLGLQRALPRMPALPLLYAGVAFFGIAFWAAAVRGPLGEKLKRKRARLAEYEDTAEMRRLALTLEAPAAAEGAHKRDPLAEGGAD
jgi:hypothetical protein